MKYLITAVLLSFYCSIKAQVRPVDTIAAIINISQDTSGIKFSSSLRELRQISGAPAPFYTYFWEFGDGTFSFEKDPHHTYRDTGTFDARIYATNNYDDGKPPPTKPKKINISKASPIKYAGTPPAFFKSGGSIELKTNRMPKPAEEMVLIVGYRNKAEWNVKNLGGKLAILYNEKQFKQDNFLLKETRKHHNEQKSELASILAYIPQNKTYEEDWKQKGGPSKIELIKPNEDSGIIKDKTALFRNSEVLRFDNLKSGEERYIFFSLNTTPEMIQDTNAVVTVSAVFIPDDPLLTQEIVDLQLQIVASHDPNKMMLKNRKMNYRFTGKKRELSYKIRFQNTGEGPAKKVGIGVRSAGILDLSTLKITGSQPKCIPCDSAYTNQSCLDTIMLKDSVQFVFKNIYLPGVKQKGVADIDSTMGYVQYTVQFKKKPKKVPFDSQAAIVFDKNEPIYTNRSVGRFKPGLSPSLIAVYGSQLNSKNLNFGNKNFSLGLSIAPFAPHRKYLQWEIYVTTFNESEIFLGRKDGGDTVINRIGYKVDYREAFSKSKVISIDAVPAQLRYNLNSFIGFGAGTLVSVNLKTENQKIKNTYVLGQNGQAGATGQTFNYIQKEATTSFNQWKTTLFADMVLGRVRVGPSIGLRYLHSLNINDKRFSTYLTWKF